MTLAASNRRLPRLGGATTKVRTRGPSILQSLNLHDHRQWKIDALLDWELASGRLHPAPGAYLARLRTQTSRQGHVGCGRPAPRQLDQADHGRAIYPRHCRIPRHLGFGTAGSPFPGERSAHLEVVTRWAVLNQIGIPRTSPRIRQDKGLRSDLEDMGAVTNQDLPLAQPPKEALD